MKIQSTQEGLLARGAPSAKGPEANLARVAREFESVFVRKLLEESHALGSGSSAGHAGMLVDAVSSAIASAGGLGLASGIERELSRGALKVSPGKP